MLNTKVEIITTTNPGTLATRINHFLSVHDIYLSDIKYTSAPIGNEIHFSAMIIYSDISHESSEEV